MHVYVSSRNKNNALSGHEALIKGLACDGGLFTPREIKTSVDPRNLLHKSYQQIAEIIIGAMFDDYTPQEISACVNGAYDDKFDTEEIVPLRKIKDGYLLELWHGPTSAFKDLALTILPRLLAAAYKKENRNDTIAILTATSGDTGKAALAGFADVDHTAITVFYPEIGVSQIQKRQMQTSPGKNVEVIAVKGNFDDCQRLVKEASSRQEELTKDLPVVISSANSINIGRLVPQIVYYYAGYVRLVEQNMIKCGDKINFTVPTGNFGDILAGYLAEKLGLPINKLICASNTNHVLTDFINTGVYSLRNRPFYTTMSPSMDILISSNLERLLFMLSANDDKLINDLMKQLKEKESYTVPAKMAKTLKKEFAGYWVDEKLCRKTIRNIYETEKVVIDPHTAVGLAAWKKYQKETEDGTVGIVLSTASPYKFARDVLRCITDEDVQDDFAAMNALAKLSAVPVPEGLAALEHLPVRFTDAIMPKDGLSTVARRIKEIAHDQN